MRGALKLLLLAAAFATGCERQAAVANPANQVSAPTGPRWVVIKADGLGCSTCAAELQRELQQTAGITQVETFAPQPYCRFYVEDGGLDVARMLEDHMPNHSTALEGYTFIRGG